MRRFLALALCACHSSAVIEPAHDPAPVAKEAPPAAPSIDARFVATMKGALAAYDTWPRADDQTHFAPTLCLAPATAPRAHESAAKDGAHARKLYSLRLGSFEGASRVIVKESWAPEAAESFGSKENGFVPYVRDANGKIWKTGARVGWFVMMKMNDESGTDAGWIYGTASVDGTITSLGKVEQCMSCHQTRPGRTLSM